MFQVQPVRSRELQAEIAKALRCEYIDGTYAFFAGELSEDCKTVTSLIGMCQFTFDPEEAVIKSLVWSPESENDEAIIILARAVMSFVYRAEIPMISIDGGILSTEFIKSLGFREADGEFRIDLKKFYLSPCHYNDV